MKSNKIVILGSKPNAKIPKGDIYYCANSAASFYNSKIDKNSKIVTLVAASEIIKSRRKSKEKDKWLAEKYNRIVNTHSNKIILVGNEFFPEALPRIKRNYKNKVEQLKFSDLNEILKKLVNKRFPVLTIKHLYPIGLNSIKNLVKFLIEKYYIISKKNKLSSGLFRPSTGILSLAYAISKHGYDSEYYVAGIGLNNRELYPDGFNNTWTPKKNLNSYHIHADEKISKLLLKKYKIHFDDDSFDSIKKNAS